MAEVTIKLSLIFILYDPSGWRKEVKQSCYYTINVELSQE